MHKSQFLFVAAILVLTGCGGRAFVSSSADQVGFTGRAIVETQQVVRVSAAVPDAAETRRLIGLDLYQQGIQPVWLKVTNLGDTRVRAALRSVDEEYFSPMEVAWKYRNRFNKQGRADMERWFFENQMPRIIPARESRSGFIFTHLAKGTKGFNFDVYSSKQSINFTFFVPIPGFVADYMTVDIQSLYRATDMLEVGINGLHQALQTLPCCSTNKKGDSLGDPLNVVLVGTPLAVRRSLLRAGWQETATNAPETAVARTHHYRNRAPDGTFQKSRLDGKERKELRLWLSPVRIEGTQVWIGQVNYDISGAIGENAIKNYQLDPDIDDARSFLMQNFWYNQSLSRISFVEGVTPSSIAAPAHNFAGAEYFTDGSRVVLFVSEKPVAMDETAVAPRLNSKSE
jgi:hypothetical protein